MTNATELMDERHETRLEFARKATGDRTLILERASMDAGFRSYWRGVANGGTVIIMDSPPDKEDVRPWLRIRDQLEARGVRVPKVFARDEDAGYLLLEDLGAHTMLQAIEQRTPEAWFTSAMDQLIAIQKMPQDSTLPVYDHAMLERELKLFDEWYVGRHLGHALSGDDAERLNSAYSRLIDAIVEMPKAWVHRDFMPRNLMPAGDGLAVLDFQDAVWGPVAYDALTLFKDAFISWPDDFVDAKWREYHARAFAGGIAVPEDFAEFERQLDWIGIQRHLKVIGIFARLCHRDSKPKYLTDAARFFAYLDGVLPKYPELAELRHVIEQTVKPAMAVR